EARVAGVLRGAALAFFAGHAHRARVAAAGVPAAAAAVRTGAGRVRVAAAAVGAVDAAVRVADGRVFVVTAAAARRQEEAAGEATQPGPAPHLHPIHMSFFPSLRVLFSGPSSGPVLKVP